MAKVLLLAFICWAGAGCGGNSQREVAVPFDPQQEVRDFPGVTYRRTGGIAGAEERITIAQDGRIETTGRFVGKRQGQVSEFQVMQLVRLLEGWEKLRSEYPAPPGTADAFQHEIEYRGKRVTASEASPEMPEQFRRVRERLETLTRGLSAVE